MNKGRPIGGIYDRPVAIANLSHFMIAGLTLLKGLSSKANIPLAIWAFGIIYFSFGVAFGIILFRHPSPEKSFD